MISLPLSLCFVGRYDTRVKRIDAVIIIAACYKKKKRTSLSPMVNIPQSVQHLQYVVYACICHRQQPPFGKKR